MSTRVVLEHRTSYAFARPAVLGPHVVRLHPAAHARTPVSSYVLAVDPPSATVRWEHDPFGNRVARLSFPEPVQRLELTVGLVADLAPVNPLDFVLEPSAATVPVTYGDALRADLLPYLVPVVEPDGQAPAPEVAAWAAGLPVPAPGTPTVTQLADLNTAVHGAVAYEVRLEQGVQSPGETLRRGVGSCRDSAWLLVALLRHHGLAARFVSGYLVQLADPDAPPDAVGTGPAGWTSDGTDLHAWAEAYLPGAGWVGLDPTGGLFTAEGHLPLAAAPHPGPAAPVVGSSEPVEVTLGHANTVRRLDADPADLLDGDPYPPEQWARVDALGEEVDRRLAAADVRLTTGGGSVFAVRDPDGPRERRLAADLAERLHRGHSVGGVVHRGDGAGDPGEPPPRAGLALQWRADGEPLWRDPDLLADPADPADRADPGGRLDDDAARQAAEALARRVATTLGLPDHHLLAAVEDDPEVVAWVLPLVPGEPWTSPARSVPGERLVLTPGAGAAGLRLPSEAVAQTLPGGAGRGPAAEAGPPLTGGVPAVTPVPADGAARTALAVEAREGRVHVFLPPTERLEDYADLLRLVEVAARRTGTAVVLEGYRPPPDPRLHVLSVTPDAGVVEVDVHPAGSWAELGATTTGLYEQARAAGLVAEEPDPDGRRSGTDGDCHLTLGGPSPAQSPLLRRADLLPSLVTYWQRHPGLSYLFSGRCVGPTGPAPRFDEGRPGAVGEMEVALAEAHRLLAEQHAAGLEPRPGLVDRAVRHLLTDLTGNTRRAELCVDQLHRPDSAGGRPGLLELRAFATAPHPQTALVQALLVRALVTLLWERPLRAPLVRWGTRLHDDFLRPSGVRRDLAEVVEDLRAAGLPFEHDWLEPFHTRRFPLLGTATAGPVRLELRAALEPGHLSGEEAGPAGYLDSSLERLEVTARGLDPARQLVTCQGVPVPLHPGDAAGVHHAGVRYRARQPGSAPDPSAPVPAPLRFEVVDVVARAGVGGVTYHVDRGRFEDHGPPPGPRDVGALRERAHRAACADHPGTLDLRRVAPDPAPPRPADPRAEGRG